MTIHTVPSPDQTEGGVYKLTDAQLMLLYEESFTTPRRSAPPVNILGFFLRIHQGDPSALTMAYQHVITTNDALRLRLWRLNKADAPDIRHDYKSVPYFHYRLRLRGLRLTIAAVGQPDLPPIRLADEAAFRDYLEQFRLRRIPLLGGGPLQAAELVFIGSEDIVLLMHFHHLVIDGYSFKLLFERLVESYESFCQQRQPIGHYPSITRVIKQDEQYRQSPRLARDFAYWHKQFTKQPRYSFPAGRTPVHSKYQTVAYNLSGPLYQQCSTLTARLGVGCSNYSLLMFVAAMTVYRLTGRTNFAMFHMSHGRLDPVSLQTIGSMINMIPVFYNLDPGQSLEQILQDCRKAYVEAMLHSRLPFNELIKLYPYEGFRHCFNFNHAWIVFSALDLEATIARTAYQAETIGAKNQPHQFFVIINDIPGERIDVQMRYQTVKYNKDQATRYLDAFIQTLNQVLGQPQASLSSLRPGKNGYQLQSR